MPSSSAVSANLRSGSPAKSRDSSQDRHSSQWPLRERSTSQVNEMLSPTIRIVRDPESPAYPKVSSQVNRPTQVVLPPGETGSVAASEGGSVSDINPSTAQQSRHEKRAVELFPKPLQPRKKYSPYPSSESTNTSEADTVATGSALSPSTSWFSQSPTPPTSPPAAPTLVNSEHCGDDLSIAATALDASSIGSDKNEPVVSTKGKAIRAFSPQSSSGEDSPTISPEVFLTSPTLSPTSPYAPVIRNKKVQRPVTVTYSAFPPPPPQRDPPRSVPNDPRSQKRASAATIAGPPVPPKTGLRDSLNLSKIPKLLPPSDRPRSSSSPTKLSHASQQANTVSGTVAKGQDRSFTDPSGSGFRQVLSPVSSAPPARMSLLPPRRQQWSSQLSTIASESERTNSQSEDSESNWHVWGRRPEGSLPSSMAMPSEPSEPAGTPVPMPLPLFARARSSFAGYKRDSDEYRDVLYDLQSPPMRANRWGYLSRTSVDSLKSSRSQRSSRSQSSVRTSYSNELASSLPSWARTYYRRGETVPLGSPRIPSPVVIPGTPSSISRTLSSSSRSGSPASDLFPPAVYRPRNRPLERVASGKRPESRRSSAPEMQQMNRSESLIDPEMLMDRARRQSMRRALSSHPVSPPLRQPSNAHSVVVSEYHSSDGRPSRASVKPARMTFTHPYSPHLYCDQRTTARLSVWQPPSLDEAVGGLRAMSNSNRQILLFCIGFVFPLAWMIASFLPLPYRPELQKGTSSQMNVEAALALELDPIDERRYQKARWWRNANRIMSIFGFCLLSTIIAVVVATAT